MKKPSLSSQILGGLSMCIVLMTVPTASSQGDGQGGAHGRGPAPDARAAPDERRIGPRTHSDTLGINLVIKAPCLDTIVGQGPDELLTLATSPCGDSLAVEVSIDVPAHVQEPQSRLVVLLNFQLTVARTVRGSRGASLDRDAMARNSVTLPPATTVVLVDTSVSTDHALRVKLPRRVFSIWQLHPVIVDEPMFPWWLPRRVCAEVTALRSAVRSTVEADPRHTDIATRSACLKVIQGSE